MEYFLNLLKTNLIDHTTRTTFILIFTLIFIWFVDKLRTWLRNKKYFKKLNINGPPPILIFGNFLDVMKKGLTQHDLYVIQRYGKTVGYFEGSLPVVLTTDTKFIKSVMIKDFNIFVNRRVFEGLLPDPLDKFISILKDDEWRNVRSIATTSFTSGKLKSMCKNMLKYSNNVCEYLEKRIEKDEVVNTKTLFGAFTLDVITCCCFGFETNAINDPDTEVIKHLKIIFSNTFSTNPKLFLFFLFPKLASFLSRKKLVKFLPMESFNYIQSVTDKIVELRRDKKERREDFIQSMVDHEETSTDNNQNEEKDDLKSKSSKKKLTNSEIIAQAIIFLIAGYDTTASTLGFISYNLAMNPESQQKLIEEVDQVLEKYNGEVTYEAVNEMPYMDMVIDETLRMYPPAIRLDRIAGKDYEFEGMKIPKGTIWNVPVWALHRDPENYPEPHRFMPERFSDDEKKLRDNEAYLPFGAGPRNCIGMRFATLEIKILLAKTLSKFEFIKCKQTTENIQLETTNIIRPKDPIILKVKSRFQTL